MKKQMNGVRDHIYLHQHPYDSYVISYGIEFKEFIESFTSKLKFLLLLKHNFQSAEFNMHTLLEYVPQDKVDKLINDGVYGYGNFCWVDFNTIEGLDELNGQEIAELLYMGHLKQHLKAPFFQKLGNKFVYLAHDDGWFNKVYYREINDFYDILGNVIGRKLAMLSTKKTFFGFRKQQTVAGISGKTLTQLSQFLKEGMVISLQKLEESRQRIEIPIWVIGDYIDMDDMYEEALKAEERPCEAKLVYEKKTSEWRVLL